MTQALARESTSESTLKGKRDGEHGAPTDSRRRRGGFHAQYVQRKHVCACGGGCPRCREHAGRAEPKLDQPRDGYEREPRFGHDSGQMQVGDAYQLEPEELRAHRRVRQLLAGPRLQAKLTVGAADDAYEREADRVASEVMQTPESSATLLRIQPVRPDYDEGLRNKSAARPISSGSAVAPDLEGRIRALRGRGRPLPESVRAFFEPRFGHDFSAVRLHTDGAAREAARTLRARAFTVGHDVVFGEREFRPASVEATRLLAHELTHVVQQGSARPLADGGYRIHRTPDVRQSAPPSVISRQLDPSMCSSDCAVPDGTGAPTGKYLLTIYADKEGPFLLLWLTHKVGHSWVKLVDNTGAYWTYGFWPQEGFDPSQISADVEGCVHHPDTAHRPTSEQTFELTAAEFAAAKAKAVDICSNRPKYNLFGLQCTEFVGQVLRAAGKGPALGFGLIWESPNALDSWIRSNALLLGIRVTAATTARGGAGKGVSGLDVTYTHQFFSALGNKLRLHWMSRGELSSSLAALSTGVGVEVTSQRVFLPSVYVFGGGALGDITARDPRTFGAGPTVGAGVLFNLDQIATVGVEYNLVKDLVTKDPELHRLMFSARLRLF
jgi:hypothetical protein